MTSLLLLSLGIVLAEGQVMLVTDLNTPDAFTATVTGNFEGIPVLVLNNGKLDSNVTTTIAEMNATEVILIGGIHAISSDVEDELENLGYNVTRLWGLERTRTAIEIAKYFWNNASCAVLVENLYNPVIDSITMNTAINKAIHEKCLLIPVPKNVIPAEVLDSLNSLNVSDVTFIGSTLSDEERESLAGFNLTEITGNITTIKRRVLKYVLKKNNAMVIVATPNWKEGLSVGAALNNNSIVRRVVSIDDMPEIINLIQDNNISPIKVTGEKLLAGQVINELRNNGITAVNYAGANPSAIARKLWLAEKDKFIARKNIRTAYKAKNIAMIRNRVLTLINNSKFKINELEIEIEELKAEGVDTSSLEEQLASANASVNEAFKLVNISESRARWIAIKALSVAKQRVFLKLKNENKDWRDKLSDELVSRSQLRDKINISSIENKLTNYASSCGNIDEIKSLISKAKELKEQADNEADPSKQAALLKEAKSIYNHAKTLGRICINKKTISTRLKEVVTNRLNKTNVKQARILSRVNRILRRR